MRKNKFKFKQTIIEDEKKLRCEFFRADDFIEFFNEDQNYNKIRDIFKDSVKIESKIDFFYEIFEQMIYINAIVKLSRI